MPAVGHSRLCSRNSAWSGSFTKSAMSSAQSASVIVFTFYFLSFVSLKPFSLILSIDVCVGMLQWISQVSFPRLVLIHTSASIPRVLTHLERITRSSRHRAFLRSRDLERIYRRANWLSLVRDLPTLHMVLEAAIPVSCCHSTGHTRSCALRMSRYVASITFTMF